MMMQQTAILGAIGWTTPLMFGGLTLLSLPIIAHLLNRRARRRLVFPSIMLLSESSASQTQLFKLRRWLLLLLRAIAVAMIVAAFARPLWLTGSSTPVGEHDSVAVVIVADVSASMSQQVNEVSGMQALRAAAGRVLDDLSPGVDSVNLVLADAHPAAVFLAISQNLPAIRSEIQSLKSTHERADLPAALHLAGKLLAEAPANRRLIVLSDMQTANWQPILDDPAALALPQDTQITVVDVLADHAPNLAVHHLQIEPAIALRNQPSHVTATVNNFSDRPRIVQAQFKHGRREIDAQSLEIPAWQSRDVGFDITFTEIGDQPISVGIGDDALAGDNAAYMIAPVASQSRVLVVGDDAPQSPGTASYFVTRALSPNGDQRDRIEAVDLSSASLSAAALRGASAVFVTDLSTLPQATMNLLREYLRGGGGLVIFAGDGQVAENFNPWLAGPNASADLPWQFINERKLDAEGNLLYLQTIDWNHAILKDFAPQNQDVWQRIAFRRVWTVAEQPDSQAQVVMRFADGAPAVAVQNVGRGRLVVANFSPSLSCSDLGKYGAFVALVQSTSRYVSGRWSPWQFALAGQTLSIAVPVDSPAAVSQLTITGPAGEPMRSVVAMPAAHEAVVSVSRPAFPGIYQASSGDQTVGLAAVNIDERESDLRPIPAGRIITALNRTGLAADGHDLAADGPVLALRGRPLWGWALLAGLGAMALEMLLLAYWRR